MAEDMHVVDLLLQQHGRIRVTFERVEDAAERDQRLQAFEQLRCFLAVHETAEEMVLAHPEIGEREEVPAASRALGGLGDGDHGQV